MPLAFSNKVQKPLFDFNAMFGTANSTPMLPAGLMPPPQAAATSPVKATATASTTPVVAGGARDTASLGTYKGVPIKAGDQNSIMAQMKAIDGGGSPIAPTAPMTGGVQGQNVRGLIDAPTPTRNNTAQASPTFSGIIFDLIKKATENDENVSNATKNAESINKQIQQQKEEIARKAAGVHGRGIPLEFTQGREQIIRQQGAEILAGLGEQFSGATNLLNSAVEQRGQTMGALNSAAGLAQPSPSAFGQTTFNPLAGGFQGNGGLPPDVMQQYAQMAASGQYAAIPAFITSNPVLNAQLNVAAKAFNPNFTPVGAQGASNVLSTIPGLQSAETAADGIKNTITSYLSSNPQLNPSDLAVGNKLQQWIQGVQLTDPKYQTLFNYLNEYTNTLAPILGVGGDPTNLKTQIAQSFVNAAASGQSITEVLEAISQLAKNKVTDLQRGATGQGTSVPAGGGNVGGFAEVW